MENNSNQLKRLNAMEFGKGKANLGDSSQQCGITTTQFLQQLRRLINSASATPYLDGKFSIPDTISDIADAERIFAKHDKYQRWRFSSGGALYFYCQEQGWPLPVIPSDISLVSRDEIDWASSMRSRAVENNKTLSLSEKACGLVLKEFDDCLHSSLHAELAPLIEKCTYNYSKVLVMKEFVTTKLKGDSRRDRKKLFDQINDSTKASSVIEIAVLADNLAFQHLIMKEHHRLCQPDCEIPTTEKEMGKIFYERINLDTVRLVGLRSLLFNKINDGLTIMIQIAKEWCLAQPVDSSPTIVSSPSSFALSHSSSDPSKISSPHFYASTRQVPGRPCYQWDGNICIYERDVGKCMYDHPRGIDTRGTSFNRSPS